MQLNDNVKTIKGVGDKTVLSLSKLKINTVFDVLNFLPRTYEDRTNIVNIEDLQNVEDKSMCCIIAMIKENPSVIRKNITITKVMASDTTGNIELVWYNRPFVKNNLKPFTTYFFYGSVTKVNNRYVMQSPDFEETDKSVILNSNRIVPVYSTSKEISQKQFRKIVNEVVYLADEIDDFFPEKVLSEFKLVNKAYAYSNIHFPKSEEHFFNARRRLVFDEIFLMRSNLLNMKKLATKKSELNFTNYDIQPILKALPFALTKAQERVVADILLDIKSSDTMNRLVQGDVGSGKTAIAMIVTYLAYVNGYQSAVMAPTEVLARQHYEAFTHIFKSFGANIGFLAGSLTAKEKREMYEKLKEGEIDIVIGTHAIFQEKVEYKNLGVCITDEQHRFGVRQREALSKKGLTPHVLVMTATPIPRTLGLILHGDLNISIIDELPPNRQYIDTYVVKESYLERIYKFIQKEVDDGQQVYVVCPLIEEQDDDTSKLNSVEQFTQKLKTKVSCNVQSLDGKMKQKQKDEIMADFASNKLQVLVSTTVIEVGVNVPNATIMIVLNAERFGLSQLHQLRGRVGRGEKKSHCILVSDSNNQDTKKRLDIIKSTNDGFVIAEKDLLFRGHGDFFGVRQHGLPEFKIANLFTDINILNEVEELLEKLENPDFLTENEFNTIKIEKDKFKNIINSQIIL